MANDQSLGNHDYANPLCLPIPKRKLTSVEGALLIL